MKSLFALILLLGFGCSPADKAQTSAESFSDVTTISENQAASTENPYKQLYFDYEAKVLEALSSDLDLKHITDEFVSHAEFHIPTIYLSKQSGDGNWDSLVEKNDPQLHIKLPAIHYGNFEDVHVRTIQDGMIFLETSMTTNRSYPYDIYIKMVVNPDKIYNLNQGMNPTSANAQSVVPKD